MTGDDLAQGSETAMQRKAAMIDGISKLSWPRDHFSYSVFWSEPDQEYVATVAEFPSLSWLHTDPIKALRGIRHLAISVARDIADSDDPADTLNKMRNEDNV